MPKKLTQQDREDQLLTAPKADPEDAAPRVEVEDTPDGVTRIDVSDEAVVRPGKAPKEDGR